eukprot:CAMPEP_0194182576 /NCGR_PEP_ID=MMETSP0154-20130528/25438_1 /TAXON_ID=1049557 /ORGANISM="Thalassiothrix antarctica, Strain L6-D1" /LENGTH=125 /DNA_ID=CAMNT_0038898949 /DNA_START=70 /DNA_END=444 /DNA_ORIENTATION=+
MAYFNGGRSKGPEYTNASNLTPDHGAYSVETMSNYFGVSMVGSKQENEENIVFGEIHSTDTSVTSSTISSNLQSIDSNSEGATIDVNKCLCTGIILDVFCYLEGDKGICIKDERKTMNENKDERK